MKDLHALLTAADPAAEAPELPPDKVRAMRQAVVAAAATDSAATYLWPGAISVAALVVTLIAAAVVVGRRLPPGDGATPASVVQSVDEAERRQVHFATPGGTRVIWTLDPQFTLQGGTP